MKNVILITILSIWFVNSAKTQILSLSDSTGSIANNETIAEYGQPTSDLIISYMFVTNNTANNLNVKVKKVELYQVSGAMNVFCWGLCYPPDIYVSPDPLVIGPGMTNTSDFHGEFFPSGTTGASLLRYVFFDEAYPADSVCYNVKYSTEPPSAISNIFPTEVYQGTTVELNIVANNTHFDFGPDPVVWLGNESSTITATNVLVNNGGDLTAFFAIPANAGVTSWDLNIRSLFDEMLVMEDAIHILHMTLVSEIPSSGIKVAGNPTSETIYLENNKELCMITLRLFSLTGDLVMEKDISIKKGITAALNVNSINRGLYILQINDKESVSNHKIMIE